MRIISKFKDYYDTAAAFGHDTHTTFVRETTEWEYSRREPARNHALRASGLLHFVEACADMSPGESQIYGRRGSERVRLEFSFGMVLFAAKLYPFVEVTAYGHLPDNLPSGHTEFVYALDRLYALAALYEIAEQIKKWATRRRFGRARQTQAAALNVVDFFGLSGSSMFEDLAFSTKTAVAVFNSNRSAALTVSPNLRDYQFYTRVDAWQAYQELDMFLGNLAAPENKTVRVADKDRLAQHGFDKWSFRKPPRVA